MFKISCLFLMLLFSASSVAKEPRTPSSYQPIALDKKVALVIGNRDYVDERPLNNSLKDAKDVKELLERTGFEVIHIENARLKQMREAVSSFGEKLSAGGVGLFYYAGHGIEIKGKNYLIPVDFKMGDEDQIGYEALDTDTVLGKLERTRLKLVILDACRNNPYEKKKRGGGNYLAGMEAAEGTLIAFAADKGKKAEDGNPGENGVFTKHLLQHFDTPGIRIQDMFDRVRQGVYEETHKKQMPFVNHSVIGDFYLTAPPEKDKGKINQPVDPAAFELSFWESIKGSSNKEDFEEYLKKFPNGFFVGLARNRLKVLSATPEVVAVVQPTKPVQTPAVPAPAPVSAPEVLKVFKDCPDCPEMVVIPAGSFEMGSNDYDSEKPIHRVNIGKSYALGKTEVTQGQWKAVMGSPPPELNFKNCGDNCPVERVSWDDAQEFIKKLNSKTGKQYRLPSEAEWEYACRAGGTQKYCGSEDIDSVAWYTKNSDSKTHPVSGKQANAYGLYDMSGNVWEWVEDGGHDNYSGAPSDGSAWAGKDAVRVLRGGSWYVRSVNVRSADRYWFGTSIRSNFIGFRLARMLP